MHRIIKIAVGTAGLAAAALMATATAANASVAVDNGVGHVDKGDVQSALGWNNKAFDNGAEKLIFTAGAEKVIADYKMSCYGSDAVGHRIISQPGTTTVTATKVLNAGNGKQITGFDLTATPGTFQAVGNAFVRDVTCGEGTVLFMNEGLATQPKTVAVTGASAAGLTVNGVALPNTIG